MTFDQKVVALASCDGAGVRPKKGKFMFFRRERDILFGTYQECLDQLKICYSPLLCSRDALMPLINQESENGVIRIAELLVGAEVKGGEIDVMWLVGPLIAPAELVANAYLKYKGFEP